MSGDERNHGGANDPSQDDYLWDRKGPADPEIARLERLLGIYAHAAAPRRPLRAPPSLARHDASRPRRRWRAGFAVAAVLTLCAVGARTWYQQRLLWDAGRPWQVVSQQGELRIGGRTADASAVLGTTGLLETGNAAMVRLRAAGIGEVAIGEGSRVRLVETRTGRHRMQLQQGSLWARVWAPPGQFWVGVPGAEVIDMGCEFLLQVDADGNGTLRVRSGWVQVDNYRREVLVPQGARVRLDGSGAAGTPYADDASAAFVAALDAIDARTGKVDARGDEVGRLIAATRSQDAISLLVLLQDYPELAEGPLFDRLAQLLPSSRQPTRETWRADRMSVLNAWWDALPYPRVKRWWMQWPDVLPSRNPKIDAWLRSQKSG